MKRYQRLALECEIENSSHVQVPDDALRFFTRLVIMGESFGDANNYVSFGYTSGLFDGSGNISAKTIEKYYDRIQEEMKKYIQISGMFELDKHFGVNVELWYSPSVLTNR